MKTTPYSWIDTFPCLSKLKGEQGHEIFKRTKSLTLPAQHWIYHSGSPCENYLLVVEGLVRVQKISENGHEITLYHIAAGESCKLSASCLLANQCYPAEAVTETDSKIVMLPKPWFEEAMTNIPEFKAFVFTHLERGVIDFIKLIEDIAYGDTQQRLAHSLLQLAEHDKEITVTHQKLANDLITAREVVSRLLKNFEHHGWLKLHRGKIEIINLQALREYTEHTHK